VRGKELSCLLPWTALNLLNSYFEWLKKGKDKLPFFTRNKNAERLLLLAGLYDSAIIEGNNIGPGIRVSCLSEIRRD
jgi:putative SOS response-associated peptidase YedK